MGFYFKRIIPYFFIFFGLFFVANFASAATIYVNYSTGNDTTGNGTAGAPYKTFHKGYVSSTAGDILDLTGTFTWTNADETGDSAITGYTISKELTLLGHGPDQTIIQAASSANTADRRVFTIGTTVSTTIQSLTVRYGYVQWTTYTSNSMGGGGVRNGGDLKIINSEFYSNYAEGCSYCTTAGYGGGVYNTGTTTISNSAFYSNTGYWSGGALASGSSSTANLILTNSTFYSNSNNTDSRFSTNGGGIGIILGNATVSNCTVYNNTGYNAGGFYIANASSSVYIANTIIAGNSGGSYYNFYKAAGTLVNGGYNIIGRSTNFTTTTGDWYDSAGTNVYTLSGSATTGSLNFDTQASYNDNAQMTHTYALLSNSIAINNGTTTANNGVSIPTTDQRGATRTGATDIGAFEFNGGGLSIVAPTTQASGITITDNQYKQLTFRWTNGNGMRRYVFMKQANTGTASPVDGTYYNASSTFGAGDQIGTSGWYAVAEGYATSTTVTGLKQTTDYIMQVFEYNGVGTTNLIFNTTSTSNNPLTVTTYTPTTRYCNATTGNDSTGTGTSGSPWKSFTKAYASSSPGDTLDITGTFDWSTSTESGDATYTGFTIAKDLYILGHGPDQTIFQSGPSQSYNYSKRVFTVSSNVSSTFSGVTIRNGYLDWQSYTTNTYGGGGIRNDGNLMMINSEVTNNWAGGCQYCSMGYGGGVYNTGTTTISNSSIYNNGSWYSGGGVSSGLNSTAIMSITNSSIYSNWMNGDQSSSNYGAGMGIFNGTTTVTNCTMVLNQAKNGGGLYTGGASANVQLKNTIIAGNFATTTAYNNVYKSAGTITSNGYNIVGKSTSYTSSTGDWVDSNDSGVFTLYGATTTGALNLDTQGSYNDTALYLHTVALTASTSVAVNNGNATANNGVAIPTTDQRGATRSGATDVGSYEYAGGGLSVVAPTIQASSVVFSNIQYKQMTVSWTNGNGMRRVVFMKQANTGNAVPATSTRYVASSTFGFGDQIGTSGWYTIAEGYGTSVTVTGLTASTNYIVQIFEYNGVDANQAVYNYSTATNNPLVQQAYTPITRYVNATSGNDTTGDGTSGLPWKTFNKGYVSSSPGDTLDLTGTFDWSTSTESGDAAVTGYTIGKDLTISGHGPDQTIIQAGTTLTSATDRRVFTISAGVNSTISNLTIKNGYENFSTYSSQNGGGAGINNSGTLTVNNVEVTNNYAAACSYCTTAGYGGGLYNVGTTTINNSAFYNNSAYWSGGGLASGSSGNLFMTNSTIYSNSMIGDYSSSNYGGGLGVVNGTSTVTNCTITGNGGKNGGGIYLSGASTNLYIKNTIVANNLATTTAYNNIYKSAGTITNGGYNIVGTSTSFTTTTGDWYTTGATNVYRLYGSSATGTLSLDTSAAINSNLYGTRSYALLAGSIAINNGTSTANNGISIPSTDQRGAHTTSSKDIGAYEYGGTFDGTYWTVTYSAGAHGSITGSSTQSVIHTGNSSAVTATADTGYRFLSWSDGSTANPRTDTNVTSTISVSASFVLDSVTLTYIAGSGGTVTGSSTQAITPGGNGTQVTAVPNTGYVFTSWSDGISTASRTDANVSSSLSVTANFTITTSTISYSAGAGGTISGSATQIINYGGNATAVTAVPSAGYSFVRWSDGVSSATRTDTNITASASYSASFLINSYTLAYSAGTGGTLTGSSTQVITYGGSGSAVTPTPNTGYHFVNWSDASTANPRTDTNITADKTVTANFAINTFVVTYAAGSGGTITGSSTQTIDYGSSATAVTATPNTGHSFINWSDGLTTNPRTDTNVTGTISVIANFSTSTYTIVYTAGSNGSITGSSTQSVQHGGSGSSVTAVPASGYSFASWSDGITSASRSESNVTTSQSFIANFVINTYTLRYSAGSHGSLTGSTTQAIDYNHSGVAVTAVPDTGYRFVNWSDAVNDNPRVDNNVSGNISVTANFALLNPPAVSAVTSSPSTNSVAITWTTDIAASTKVIYGPTINYGNVTSESDTVSRVVSHSVSLSGLTNCATYHFKVISGNVNNARTTSTDYSFITTGCVGSSPVATSTSEILAISTTSTVSLVASTFGIMLEVPPGYSSTSADFQIKKLVHDTVVAAVGSPNGYIEAGDYIYNFHAITDNLFSITNFSTNLTMTMSYGDADVVGLVESSLKIFYWNGSAWSALNNCVVDELANTVTCDTNHFSTFGLFGERATVVTAATVFGGAFIPPSTPKVLISPKISGNKIISQVSNVSQIAVADNSAFSNSSWQPYVANYDASKFKGKTFYIKYRSLDGGESQVYVVNLGTTSQVISSKNYQFKRDLKFGNSHGDVKQLQIFLNNNGFKVSGAGVGSLGKETSYFGTATKNALIKFQKANKISPANGVFGSLTRTIINKWYNK